MNDLYKYTPAKGNGMKIKTKIFIQLIVRKIAASNKISHLNDHEQVVHPYRISNLLSISFITLFKERFLIPLFPLLIIVCICELGGVQ